jgi:hypothetical protein
VDLVEVFRAVGRRWYVLFAGLLLTAGACVLIFRVVPVTYDITASVLLLPPSVQEDAQGEQQVVNPFLNLGGLDVAAGVLVKALTDSASVEEVIPEGSTTEYTVEKDAGVSGSVLQITVSAESPEVAVETLNQVLDLAEVRLEDLQDQIDAADRSQVRLMVVTDNSIAEPNYSTLIRTLIVVAGGGLALTLLIAVSIDTAVRRRRATAETAAPTPPIVTGAPAAAAPQPPSMARPSPPLVDRFLDGRAGNGSDSKQQSRPERKPG